MDTQQCILVVCEDPGMLEHIGKYLCEHQFDVRCVGSGREAVELYAAWSAALIVADYRLSDLNGLELVEVIRRLNPQARFILLTPHGDGPEFSRATQGQVITYLGKPFQAEELMHTVRRSFNSTDALCNRREHNRYPFNVETQCILINPFDDSESRPVPALIRDVSRSGIAMIVRQLLPVPAMIKIIFHLPRQQHAHTVLAKSVSCTLTQIPGVYRLGARFIGLLPHDMEKAIALGTNDGAEDIFMGKSFKDAVREWLNAHQHDLPAGMAGLTPADLADLAQEMADETDNDLTDLEDLGVSRC